jgi:hypothetical protein
MFPDVWDEPSLLWLSYFWSRKPGISVWIAEASGLVNRLENSVVVVDADELQHLQALRSTVLIEHVVIGQFPPSGCELKADVQAESKSGNSSLEQITCPLISLPHARDSSEVLLESLPVRMGEEGTFGFHNAYCYGSADVVRQLFQNFLAPLFFFGLPQIEDDHTVGSAYEDVGRRFSFLPLVVSTYVSLDPLHSPHSHGIVGTPLQLGNVAQVFYVVDLRREDVLDIAVGRSSAQKNCAEGLRIEPLVVMLDERGPFFEDLSDLVGLP